MVSRLKLQMLLEELLGSGAVYFQPPGSQQLSYPCIIYERDVIETEYANNNPYRHTKRYSVTLIDRKPDSEILDKIAALPTASHSRHFKADQLNHDVFTLHF